jgi:hypothetical protein
MAAATASNDGSSGNSGDQQLQVATTAPQQQYTPHTAAEKRARTCEWLDRLQARHRRK